MAKKTKGTFAQAQAALSRAFRDFEKSVSGLVGSDNPVKSTKKAKRKTAKRAKRKSASRR
jgi:hypothetical protein